MFRVTRYPMISKTESGRVRYRKKYRVAGRVRVPAGHWLVGSELSGRLCGQYDLKIELIGQNYVFLGQKAQFWAPLGWFFSHFCPESIYKLRLRNLVDSQTIRNCLQASGIILRPGLFGPDLGIVRLWEKIKFFVARLWWLHSLSKIWSLFSLLHKFKLYVY